MRWSPKEWPGALIALYQGSGTPNDVIEAARNGDPITQRAQECEALFYSGQYELTRGAKADATALLTRSLDVCPSWRDAARGGAARARPDRRQEIGVPAA